MPGLEVPKVQTDGRRRRERCVSDLDEVHQAPDFRRRRADGECERDEHTSAMQLRAAVLYLQPTKTDGVPLDSRLSGSRILVEIVGISHVILLVFDSRQARKAC